MADIKFGVQIGSTWEQGLPSGSDLLDLARSIEGLGYDSIHSTDHITSPPYGPAPVVHCFPFLAAAAAVTQRVKIGPCTLQLPGHNASLVASIMLGLHHMSHGRALLNVSQADVYPNEMEAAGSAWEDRGPKNAEGIELIKKLWSEDKVTFEGKYNKVTDLNMAISPSLPPIPFWVGGRHANALQRAARLGDAYSTPQVTPSLFKENSNKVKEIGAEDGRDLSNFEWVTEIGFHMGADKGKVRDEAARALGEWRTEPPTEELLEVSAALGSPDDCAQRIQDFVDSGVTWFVLTPLCTLADLQGQLQSFAKEVLPKVRAVKAPA
jgi:alkanesulfonate monooxygenase SsuD/methylene tetrahydromethanopterin reductase-like flavin-dependent oxidoreductase (luciferase family)